MSCFEGLDTVISSKSINLNQVIQIKVSGLRYEAPLWGIYREFNKLSEGEQFGMWEQWMQEGFLSYECPPAWDDLDSEDYDTIDFAADQGAKWEYWLDNRNITTADWIDFLTWLTRKACEEASGIQETIN